MKELFARAISGPWTTSGLDVQYRVERDGDIAYIFFQGSASDSDWVMNFDFAIAPYRDMDEPWFAHRGFVRMYKSVADEIALHIEAMDGLKEVVIAGYSQGAALATLAHEDIGWRFKLGIKTYAFASPRVLWFPTRHVMRRWVNLQRWTLRGDLVPMVPPSVMGYRHVGEKHLIGPIAIPWLTHHRAAEYEGELP